MVIKKLCFLCFYLFAYHYGISNHVVFLRSFRLTEEAILARRRIRKKPLVRLVMCDSFAWFAIKQ